MNGKSILKLSERITHLPTSLQGVSKLPFLFFFNAKCLLYLISYQLETKFCLKIRNLFPCHLYQRCRDLVYLYYLLIFQYFVTDSTYSLIYDASFYVTRGISWGNLALLLLWIILLSPLGKFNSYPPFYFPFSQLNAPLFCHGTLWIALLLHLTHSNVNHSKLCNLGQALNLSGSYLTYV